jgi:hypothetical protein
LKAEAWTPTTGKNRGELEIQVEPCAACIERARDEVLDRQ